MKLFYLGPEGTFSNEAALALAARLGGVEDLSPQVNVEAVARQVAGAGDARVIGLVPYYNFLEGLVQEHLDLIYEFRLRIVGALRLPVELAAGGFDPGSGGNIYSHPKALAQVSGYIQSHFPGAALAPVSSTAEAARLVSAQKAGLAIASETALQRFGVPVVARNIGNLRHGQGNFTDFFAVCAEGGIEVGDLGPADQTLVAVTPHIDRLGLLAELLGQFSFYGLNIAKIHSRPAIDAVEGSDEPQMFYLEIKAAPDSDALARCIEAIRYRFGGEGPSADPVRVMGGFRL